MSAQYKNNKSEARRKQEEDQQAAMEPKDGVHREGNGTMGLQCEQLLRHSGQAAQAVLASGEELKKSAGAGQHHQDGLGVLL